MNRIVIESIGFKNFMSYGSKWTDIELKNGINFVTGIDKDKNKSNGSGKSTFLEVISFALFGKVARNIKQSQIINWKNRKKLEVVIRFTLNDNKYEIFRGLKPNKLEIYKNGTIIDQDAHKGDYQAMFEEIFGMDVKMFMSLIHSNVNNSGSIMSMKKAEKRVFLEKMFGLEVYSDMNKLSNEKLRRLDEKKFKAEVEISVCDSNIKNANNFKDKFGAEIKSKEESIEDIDKIEEKLKKIKKDNPNIDSKIEQMKESIDENKNTLNCLVKEFEKKKAVLDTKLESIDEKIIEIEDQESQRKRNESIKADLKKIIDKQGDFDVITKKIEKITTEKEGMEEEVKKLNKEEMVMYKELSVFKADLNNIQKSLKLLKDGKCPTCGQDTDVVIKGHNSQGNSLKKKIDSTEENISSITDSATDLQENVDKLTKKSDILSKLKDKIVELKSQIKDIGSKEDKEKLIKAKDLITQQIKKDEKSYNNDSKKLNSKIEKLKKEHTDLIRIKEDISNAQKEYDIAVSKAEEVEKSIKSLHEMIKEQDENINKAIKEREKIEKNVEKLNDLADYLNTIKTILKDENIKQFTIKQIIPFLNKQANHYLSEVNYGFYISIDKWMDIDIKGPGIRNATYDSLSGGERRGVDLALQLALLDVCRLQANIFPDILIFDEILDSSIDNVGITQLMKIIKTKQHEFGGKIFIITHRSEIPQDLVDNQYFVEKSNGFSNIKIV